MERFFIFRPDPRWLLGCVVIAVAFSASAAPRLLVDAPPSLRGVASGISSYDPRRLESIETLTGANEPQPPIHVILATPDSALARGVPPWISGWAYPELGTIVLLPSRAVRYPSDGIEELLRHEIAHVLIARASAGQPVPRWFHEGLAMLASRGWTLEDRGRLMFELMGGREMSIAEVEQSFAGGETSVTAAYAFSGAFVRDLIRRHGNRTAAGILRRVAAGVPFDRAFLLQTGDTVSGAEHDFWRSQTLWNRWIPFLTSSVALWMVITLLAMWAMRKRQARDALIRRKWEEEGRDEEEETVN